MPGNPRVSDMARNRPKPPALNLFGRPMPAQPDGLPLIVTHTVNGVRHVEPMMFWRKG